MRLRYIGHASVTIETAARRIVCDPWWNGPAFAGRWRQFPAPRPEIADAEKPDFIFVSHGHEGHLHVPTLRLLRKDAVVLLPELPDTTLRDVFSTLGFLRIVELRHGTTQRLSPGLHATVYRVHEGSILVIDGDGRTLVNVNDALSLAPRHVVDHVCNLVRSRHPHIDTALIGYTAPHWLPGCIRLENGLRADLTAYEQAAAETFATVAQRLRPTFALPVGGSQVFVDPDAQWINAARLRAESPCAVLRRADTGIQTHWLAPGDRLVGDQIRPAGGQRPTAEDIDFQVRSVSSAAEAEHRETADAGAPQLARLVDALRGNAMARGRFLLAAEDVVDVRIDVRDLPATSLRVHATRGSAVVERCDPRHPAPCVLTAPLAIVEALATQDYGDECILHGCGAVLHLRERDLGQAGLLLQLLGRRPLAPRRRDLAVAWWRTPRRMWRAWRAGAHWRELASRLRDGDVWASPGPEALDPALWTAGAEGATAPEFSA